MELLSKAFSFELTFNNSQHFFKQFSNNILMNENSYFSHKNDERNLIKYDFGIVMRGISREITITNAKNIYVL